MFYKSKRNFYIEQSIIAVLLQYFFIKHIAKNNKVYYSIDNSTHFVEIGTRLSQQY